jgi:hypothetical protein
VLRGCAGVTPRRAAGSTARARPRQAAGRVRRYYVCGLNLRDQAGENLSGLRSAGSSPSRGAEELGWLRPS